MTISSSLNAGVAGLATNASRLATISDNIANSSTIGYKRADASFRSMVTASGSGAYTAGGVSVTTMRLIDQAGALRTTSNSTDLAVRGRGFLPVTPISALTNVTKNYPMNLATTGSFRANSDGYLVTDSGFVLLGWQANSDGSIPDFARDTGEGLKPVQINVNQSTGEPTTQMGIGLNLPATETEFGASGDTFTLPVEYFDNLGRSQTVTIKFQAVLPATATDPATNSWNMTIEDSASPGVTIGDYDIVFDATRTSGGTIASISATTGVAYDPATGLIQVNVAGGPIDIDLGAVGVGSGLTQFSDSFAPSTISKDGSPVGSLVEVEVDRNGFVRANFDNGLTRVVYQIPLVDMPNANGLVPQDGQTYAPSTDSGSFFLWGAGQGATGDIVAYALEESSTDVAAELTALIQTQRAYSSNAKVIQTVDEMLQETTNIKR